MEHKTDTYRDGVLKVPFCKICGKEGLELNSDCSGKHVDDDKKLDKSKEQS